MVAEDPVPHQAGQAHARAERRACPIAQAVQAPLQASQSLPMFGRSRFDQARQDGATGVFERGRVILGERRPGIEVEFECVSRLFFHGKSLAPIRVPVLRIVESRADRMDIPARDEWPAPERLSVSDAKATVPAAVERIDDVHPGTEGERGEQPGKQNDTQTVFAHDQRHHRGGGLQG